MSLIGEKSKMFYKNRSEMDKMRHYFFLNFTGSQAILTIKCRFWRLILFYPNIFSSILFFSSRKISVAKITSIYSKFHNSSSIPSFILNRIEAILFSCQITFFYLCSWFSPQNTFDISELIERQQIMMKRNSSLIC